MTTSMMTSSSSPALIVRSAKVALETARDDFTRLAIRDQGRAAQEAAKILGLRDIQVSASEIVARAERAVVKANPPVPAAERNPTGTQDRAETPESNPEVSAAVLRKMRQAHAMPDETFETIINKARAKQQPLSRTALARVAAPTRTVEPPQSNGQQPTAPAPSEVDSTTAEAMRQRIGELQVDLATARERAENAEEISAFLREQMQPEAASREQMLNNQRAQIKTLTSQVREWQTKFEDQRRETAALRRELKKHEAAE